ncbi:MULTISPECIES: hypothetical protein [Sorangium]|uniref:Uncharacterized protein n=1 Tax=Sorangium cellulosum TaxID=56 RepID=A0A4P2R0J0_SORCE|nr:MULTISPECIES: hypothetical protein [Sorangium]AUX36126.1 hypothetical protein SOCE836_083320 [Sorangium cellulosum]WCQ95429.1 hypothetical protein NQZ70_08205 [Sorangium sp. Soce836]
MRITTSALLILGPSIILSGCREIRETEPAASSSGNTSAGSWGSGGGAGGDAVGGGGAGGSGGSPPAEEAWHRQISGPDMEDAMALAIDSGANVVLAGSSRGAADFGAGATPLAGFEDLFIAKYADDGVLRWVHRFGGSLVTATGIAVDANDGIAVVGHISSGPLEAGDLSLDEPERNDIFVLALDRAGAPRWMHRLGGAGFDFGGRVATGPDDDIVVAAQSEGRLTLARFAADGTARFARDLGHLSGYASSFAPIGGVAVDLHGDILVAGNFSGGADLGGGAITGLRGDQAWVAKYSGEDGAHVWSRHFGAPEDHGMGLGDKAQTLLVDERGDVLIAGQFAVGADLGEGPIGEPGGAFLAKLAGEDGAVRWAKPLPAAGVVSTSLSFTPDGRVALIASLRAPFDLGGGTVDERGSYMATYEPTTGAFVAQRRIVEVGTMISDTQNGFFGMGASAIDAKGNLAIVTSFYEEAQTGFGALKSEGWGDILLAHLPL